MIIRIKNINPYGRYFLATEADNDTEEEATPKKRNVKVVSAGPDRRRKDFTKIEDEEPEEDTTSNEPDEPETTDDDNDFTDTSDNTEDDSESSEENVDDPDMGDDDTDFTDTEDEPDNGTTTDDSTEDSGNESDTDVNEDEPPTDDGAEDDSNEDDGPETGDEDETDFADAGEDGEDEGDDTSDDSSEDGEDGNADKKVGVDLSSTRKYNLYKEYMSLYNSCNNYIGKLENVIKDDAEVNQVIRLAVVNLRKIKDLIYDYMIIRFSLNSYVQSLLFYQKMVVSVQLVFKMLASIKKNNLDKTKH